MKADAIWRELNIERPDSSFLKSLLALPLESREDISILFRTALEEHSTEQEWAIMNWLHYARVFDPGSYFDPVFQAVKELVLEIPMDELIYLQLYNSLGCFLEDVTGPEHEAKLLAEWRSTDDEDWREDLLSHLAKARTLDPEALSEMVKTWDEDPIRGSFFLSDHPHPKLIECARTYLLEEAPWYKYIWSKVEIRSFRTMDWIEVTSAWVKVQFPEENKIYDQSMKPLESLENWINFMPRPEDLMIADFDKNDEYVRWREEKIERQFLSSLPEDWREWYFSPIVSQEMRLDFQHDLQEAGLFRLGSVSKNGPCPCGSGKKAKRCCHAT